VEDVEGSYSLIVWNRPEKALNTSEVLTKKGECCGRVGRGGIQYVDRLFHRQDELQAEALRAVGKPGLLSLLYKSPLLSHGCTSIRFPIRSSRWIVVAGSVSDEELWRAALLVTHGAGFTRPVEQDAASRAGDLAAARWRYCSQRSCPQVADT
jgi:hypothetical protein